MRGVFVTGTDTGVGKTLVAACLVRAWDGRYWKPVQTGAAEDVSDTETVCWLADIGAERWHPPAHIYTAPLSPHAAAAWDGAEIHLSDFSLPAGAGPLVVEGAGGLMVPLNPTDLMIDLIGRLGLPVVLVSRSTLGTINHTLLSLEALRRRAVPVLGVVINGPPNPENRAAIASFGRVPVIAELPTVRPVDATAVARLTERIPPLEHLSR